MNEPAQEATIDTKEEKTYYDIEQPGDVPVGEALEDLDLAVEVIEELRAQPTPVHGLDRDLVTSFLDSGIPWARMRIDYDHKAIKWACRRTS